MAGYASAVVAGALRGRSIAGTALALVLLASMVPEAASHYTGRRSLHIRDVVAFIDRSYQPGDRLLSFMTGFDHYSEGRYTMERRPGSAFENKNWGEVLRPYLENDGRLWIILPARRNPLNRRLEVWLTENAQLKWRRYEERFDYTHRGYQVFLVPDSKECVVLGP